MGCVCVEKKGLKLQFKLQAIIYLVSSFLIGAFAWRSEDALVGVLNHYRFQNAVLRANIFCRDVFQVQICIENENLRTKCFRIG